MGRDDINVETRVRPGSTGCHGALFSFLGFFSLLAALRQESSPAHTVSRCKVLACVKRITTTKSGRVDPVMFVTNLSTSLGQRANLTGSEPRHVLQRGTEREGEKGRETVGENDEI